MSHIHTKTLLWVFTGNFGWKKVWKIGHKFCWLAIIQSTFLGLNSFIPMWFMCCTEVDKIKSQNNRFKFTLKKDLATTAVTASVKRCTDYRKKHKCDYQSDERPLDQQCHRLDGVRHREWPWARKRAKYATCHYFSLHLCNNKNRSYKTCVLADWQANMRHWPRSHLRHQVSLTWQPSQNHRFKSPES